MNAEAIKSVANNAKKTAMEGGTTVVKALGRSFEYLGGVLGGVAKTVSNWVRTFFNNLPQYLQIAKKYARYGIDFVHANRTAVAVGSGIGVGVAAIAFGIARMLNRAEDV